MTERIRFRVFIATVAIITGAIWVAVGYLTTH